MNLLKLTNLFLAGWMMFPVLCWSQASMPGAKMAGPGLSPGDLLQVHMYDFPELGTGLSVHVAPDGSVHLPYAGTIQVAGMSPDQFQVAITDALRTRGIVKDPNVTVDVTTAVNMTVEVIGQVNSPRPVPLYAPAPLSFLISSVGGLNGLAAHHVTIIHPGDEAPTGVDYEPESPSPEALHTMVNPGDVVHVGSRGVYFVVGEIARPGIYPVGGGINVGTATAQSGLDVVKNLTLLGALAQAGGITAIAARSQMRILRTVDGKREEIIVDEVKLYKGEVADPLIHPNDIIFVPTSYLRQQTNNLFTTALSSLYAVVQVRQLQ